MWKRDEAVRPASGQPAAPQAPQAPAPAGAPAPRAEASQNRERDNVNIGKSVVIKGELNGSEDLTIEGQVEGTIQLRDHVLTIGANGRIKAQVFAKSVIVLGEVTGNVTASEKVDIRDNGSVDGDIVVAARGDCGRRAFPRQRRHAAQGRTGGAASREAGRDGRNGDTGGSARSAGRARRRVA